MKRRDEIWKADSLAKNYLKGVRGGIPQAARQIEVMIRLVDACGRPVEKFLDLGCGGGVLGAAMLERYGAAQATLLDFSEPMLEEAKRQLSRCGEQVRFARADFSDPSWLAAIADRAPFDAIVSAYAIHHQPDERKRILYKEIFGLLEPGGIFVNLEHVSSASAWGEEIWDSAMVASLAEYNGRTKTGKSADEVAEEYRNREDKDANILAPVGDQCGWLEQIGFECVDCYFKYFELAVFAGRRPEN